MITPRQDSAYLVNGDSAAKALHDPMDFLGYAALKAYLLQRDLDRLRTYHYEGAALRYLHQWMDQPRWQRLEPFQKLAEMLLSHLEGILNYCRVPVRFGVVEAVNGNVEPLLRRGAGIQETLPAAQSAAVGGAQDGIPGPPKRGVKMGSFRFLPRGAISRPIH